MATNDFYHSFKQTGFDHGPKANDSFSQQPHTSYPQETYTSTSPRNAHKASPYDPPPQSPQRDYSYHRQSLNQPYGNVSPAPSGPILSGGRDHEQTAYADNVPLRPTNTKDSHNGYPTRDYDDDPAIIDRPAKKQKKKKKWFERIPWVVYTLTFIQCAVFIAELAKNGALTSTPIEVKPQFNPMVGPSPYVLINMGARYVPCMRRTSHTLDAALRWPCPNTTSSDVNDEHNSCSLSNLCGFGDQPYTQDHLPHQWFRFITPMFLHAGFIHLGFNMLLQILIGGDMERAIGPIKFVIIYLSSGIFGFVLGGNYAPEGISSTGASGALFGIIALLLLDLLFHWGERRSPWVDLMWIGFDIAISFALGLLPGLDNFSHIGGFLMGLCLGICLLHSPEVLRKRIGADLPPYGQVGTTSKLGVNVPGIVKQPVGFFKGRKPLWWAWWLIRAAALVGVLAGFIALLNNFYSANPTKCSWCKHLSCIDIKNWCNIGQLQITNSTSPSKLRLRDAALPVSVAEWM